MTQDTANHDSFTDLVSFNEDAVNDVYPTYMEWVETVVDECEDRIKEDGGEGEHPEDRLVREEVELAVFDEGPARAAFIIGNSDQELGDWEQHVNVTSTDQTGRRTIEAVAYSKLIQDVTQKLRDRGYDI